METLALVVVVVLGIAAAVVAIFNVWTIFYIGFLEKNPRLLDWSLSDFKRWLEKTFCRGPYSDIMRIKPRDFFGWF
ncbi:MAG: hypothetical protein WCL30_02705 [Pseudomonadota bacterium]